MKAIETRYNGHRFRSRTEARWAVFFDHLGVVYEYEPEGYTLEGETRYLPDFYLPREDNYVEVKGGPPTDDEVHKAGLLAYASGKWVNILSGQPGQHEIMSFHGKKPLPEAMISWLDACPDPTERWSTAGRLSGPYAVPNRFFDVPWVSSIVPRYDTRYGVHGIKKDPKTLHIELDYAPEFHRLMVWKAYLGSFNDRQIVDERYGLYGVCETRQTVIQGGPWGITDDEWPRAKRTYYYPKMYAPSSEFLTAIEAARSARFEFGEEGVRQ